MPRTFLLSLCLSLCLLCAPALAEDFVITEEQPGDTIATAPPTATEVPVPAGFDTLRYGSSNEDVRIAQQRLSDLGFYQGQVNGTFDEITQRAVEAFQQANGLAATGKINATTWWAMMDVGVRTADGTPVQSSPTQAALEVQPAGGEIASLEAGWGTETQTPGAEATAIPITPGDVPALSQTLYYGSQGEQVSLLQQRLLDLGYLEIQPTANFAEKTQSAVKAFQQKHRLSNDGIVGSATWAALFAADAIPASGQQKPLQYLLTVDVTNQITYAYELDENGQHTILARRMICSTGTSGYETPQKTTQSAGDRARWGYFPKWGGYAQYLTRIDSLNAFHSVLYESPDVNTLKVGSYNSLGQQASHGCVRLLVEDAKWIYDNCPNGTTITVYAGTADPELTESLKPPPLDSNTLLPTAVEPMIFPEVWDPMSPPENTSQLRKGKEGVAVWWLQHLLAQMGYYKGTITGGYYGGTAQAIKDFQRDNGLSADGICGEKTWTKLLAAASGGAIPAATAGTDQIHAAPTDATPVEMILIENTEAPVQDETIDLNELPDVEEWVVIE